jgi:uncharacterized membrane protein
MELYPLIKIAHIVSATILFGTGLGIAFFMWRSRFTEDLREKLFAARTTVLADYVFTAPAALVQPLTGLWLIRLAGYNWSDRWLVASYALYVLAGACWLPVVWMQIQMKKMTAHSIATDSPLPARYHRLFRAWFALGWPAFLSLVIMFVLMVLKPV